MKAPSPRWPTAPTANVLPPVPPTRPFVSGTRRRGKKWPCLRGHEKPVEWLTYSPDGQRICSLDGESGRLWDATTGRAIAVLGGPVRDFTALFTPDSRRLVIGLDRQVCLYDAITGRQIAVLGSHEHQVVHLAVSPDGKRIASHGDHEKTIRLWDGVTGREVAVLRGAYGLPGGPGLQPRRVAPGLGKSVSGQYRTPVGRGDRTADRRHAGPQEYDPIGRVQPGRPAHRLGSSDQTAWLWDGVTGQPIAPLRGHTESAVERDLQPRRQAGRHRLGRSDAAALGRDVRRPDRRPARPQGGGPGAAFAAHGSLLVSRSADGESRVWDMELAERNGILRGHESFVYDVAFSPDGTRVASAAWDGTVRLWDATTGRQTAVLRHDHRSFGGQDRQFRGLAPRRQTSSPP